MIVVYMVTAMSLQSIVQVSSHICTYLPLWSVLLSLGPGLPRPTDPPQLALLTLPHPRLHHGPTGNPHQWLRLISQGIHTDTQGGLSRQHPTDLALVLGSRLSDQGGVVDEAVLWCVVFSLEGSGDVVGVQIAVIYIHYSTPSSLVASGYSKATIDRTFRTLYTGAKIGSTSE